MPADRRAAALERVAHAREVAKLPTLDFADPGRTLLLELAGDVEAMASSQSPWGPALAAAVKESDVDALRVIAGHELAADGWTSYAVALRDGHRTAVETLGFLAETQNPVAPAVWLALGVAAAAEARR